MNNILKTASVLALATALSAASLAQNASSFKEAGGHWSMVKRDLATFDKTVKAKSWKTVHEAAFNVRDDVRMLPAASKALKPAAMAKLNAHVKLISSLAGELDEAGDAGNGAKVVKLAAAFRKHVNMIPSLYPKRALTAASPMGKMPMKMGAGGHAGHGGH